MMPWVRRPFGLALAVSLLLHVLVLTAPGWGLPESDEESVDSLLETRLAPVPKAAPRRSSPGSHSMPKPPVRKPPPAPEASAPAQPAPATESPTADAISSAPEKGFPSVTPTVAPAPVSEMASRWPRAGRLVFQVIRGEGGLLVGESTHTWQHDNEQYELKAVTETVGLAALFRPARVEQVSQGGFDVHGLRPHQFETLRDGKRRESVHFDLAQGQVSLSNGQSGPLRPGTQDLLALFHQLGAHPADQVESTLNIATGRKMAAYRIVLVGVEMVVVPYGEFRARHYLVAGDKSDDATEIWIDQKTGLPVKIRHRDRKGEVFDQLVTQIELKDAP